MQLLKTIKLVSKKVGSKSDVTIQEAYYYEDEVRYITNEIMTLVNHNGYKYNDIAVIYRNGALSRNFEIAFIQEKIPYNIYGSFAFLKRKEVKDMISYLRFIADPSKIVHFKRIINVPSRGVGEKTIEKLQEYMKEYNCDILSSIDIFKENNTTSKINRIDNVKEFKSILYQIEYNNLDQDLTQAEKIEIGLDELLLDTSTIDDHTTNGVVLSTIHSVKGLEFKAVFVVGLEEGIFPAIREEVDMEEERRVAYVAFTRAKEKLYITCSARRLIYGRLVRNPKSRFLIEYLNAEDIKKAVEEKKIKEILPGEIEVGSRINHKFFGNGLVIAKDDYYVQILFDKDQSIKKISKGHPTLTKIA